jgi:hypothetical protein
MKKPIRTIKKWLKCTSGWCCEYPGNILPFTFYVSGRCNMSDDDDAIYYNDTISRENFEKLCKLIITREILVKFGFKQLN